MFDFRSYTSKSPPPHPDMNKTAPKYNLSSPRVRLDAIGHPPTTNLARARYARKDTRCVELPSKHYKHLGDAHTHSVDVRQARHHVRMLSSQLPRLTRTAQKFEGDGVASPSNRRNDFFRHVIDAFFTLSSRRFERCRRVRNARNTARESRPPNTWGSSTAQSEW